MAILTDLQRRILIELEEAGEESLTALANTVGKPHGTSEEMCAMADAFMGLVDVGVIEIAVYRENTSRRWIPLSGKETTSLLQDFNSLVEWSIADGFWKWKSDLPNAVALLTNSGRAMARQVLAEDGWPTNPLDHYG
jgi:hypothetical protein